MRRQAPAAPQTQTAHRGYSITKNPMQGTWIITKEGHYIATAQTLDEARATIDLVVG